MDNMFNDDDDDMKIGGMYEDDFSFNRALSFREMQPLELPQDPHNEGSILGEAANLSNGDYRHRLSQMARELETIDGNLKDLVDGKLPANMNPKQCSPTTAPNDLYKLQRGRASAKESRARKKLYVDLMELKLSKLQEQKEMLQQQLEQVRRNISEAASFGETGMSFVVALHSTFKKLEELFNNKKEDDLDEINIILDSMRYRIGATGKERISTVNEFFKQILNICFPALDRYLMWSASEQQHISRVPGSKNKQNDEWYDAFGKTLGLTEDQINRVRLREPFLKTHKQELDAIMREVQLNKAAIFKHSEKIDEQVDNFRNILSPLQCARFVYFIQRNRYRPELADPEHISTAALEKQLQKVKQEEAPPRTKRVKRS